MAKFKLVKCKCNKSWCPQCSKINFVRPLIEHVSDWDWRNIRMITLTIDPKIFNYNPEIAFDTLTDNDHTTCPFCGSKFSNKNLSITKDYYIFCPKCGEAIVKSRKAVPSFFRNLQRNTLNKICLEVLDWERVIEFHRNGFPHWHILVKVNKQGKAGMIKGDNIRKHWVFGRVHETYFKSEKDFKYFIGYFGKHGYFEDKEGKEHQVTLPDWARKRTSVIRRRSRMASSSKKIDLEVNSDDFERRKKELEELKKLEKENLLPVYSVPVFDPDREIPLCIRQLVNPFLRKEEVERYEIIGSYFERVGKNFNITQGQLLDKCGSSADIWEGICFSSDGYFCHIECNYQIVLNEIKRNFQGGFEEGKGFIFSSNSEELLTFISERFH